MVLHLACVVSLGSLLTAQTVVPTVLVAAPVACAVTVGTQVATQTLQAGPVGNQGVFSVVGGGPGYNAAAVDWDASVTSADATFRVSLTTILGSGTFAHVGTGEFVVSFAGAGPAAIPVRYTGDVRVTGNGLSTSVAVDVGNDGTFDWFPGFAPLSGAAADLVAQPLQMRVLLDASSHLQGTFEVEFELRLRPDYGIHTLPVAANCGTFNTLAVATPWDRTTGDVQLRAGQPALQVLGLSAPMQLLPPSLTLAPLPCFLVPAPDALHYTDRWSLQIPQAFRPITLHAQLVDFVPAVRVSDAFHIFAF